MVVSQIHQEGIGAWWHVCRHNLGMPEKVTGFGEFLGHRNGESGGDDGGRW
jgi:hypothetical protein